MLVRRRHTNLSLVRRKQTNPTVKKSTDRRITLLMASYEQHKLQTDKQAKKKVDDQAAETKQEKKPQQKLLPIPYGILFKNDEGAWCIQTEKGIQTPCGSYAFVRTKLGFIRVAPAPAGYTNHLAISGHADEVRYAGVINFSSNEKGTATLTSWDNGSGGYKPPAEFAFRASLPLNLFKAVNVNPSSSKSNAQPAPEQKVTLSKIPPIRSSSAPDDLSNAKNNTLKLTMERITPYRSVSMPLAMMMFSHPKTYVSPPMLLPKNNSNSLVNAICT